MATTSELVWLITGTSSGLGRQLSLETLARGDKVIATTRPRSLANLENLRERGAAVLALDVQAPLEELRQIAAEAVKIYGRVDVVVNNAGYPLFGAIEENTPEETEDQFQTNVFGALNITRAFLPYMRERRSGTIVWIGSLAGWTALPYIGLYGSTKWALRGISYCLHEEIAPLGLRSVCIDFGYFRTEVLQEGRRVPATYRIDDYKSLVDSKEALVQAKNGNQPGDPVKGVKVIADIVHGTGVAKDKAFPLGVCLGSDAYNVGVSVASKNLELLEEWKDVSFMTDFVQ
ncbi:short chain dehydrogenase [Coprinopsis marcescibilis]|uniref:Short chain dehydrogenase n=1 Tax=Coprinopsis marcescibilis TaxID=230819 RepID=A0A5C3KDV1_COPMA|nr:short chain dehydrogenase [Coprinopsis marcescibilis]